MRGWWYGAERPSLASCMGHPEAPGNVHAGYPADALERP